MRTLPLMLAALAVATTAARADFVVKDSQPVAAPAPGPAPLPADTRDTQPDDSEPTPKPAPTPPRFKMAYGSGTGASRVRLPPDHSERRQGDLRAGRRPQQVVSWKGGDTWNHVLRDAVKPLGLHLVMAHMAVEIRE